ncbi:MAG TPA: hypothetical protein VK826_08615 [Bacteroidia bacterium]|nr:hypothetical protein [Bacteroidia bacterium]
MKKLFSLGLLAFGLLTGANALAQDATGVAVPQSKTETVVASIPSLQSIAMEIAQFEAKTEGKKENYENANADLRALKMKYAAELQVQIAVNKDNKEVFDVLTEELRKTNEEIEKLK